MKISYKDKEYDIEVIKKRNKNIYIRVKDEKVIVTCGLFVRDKVIDKLIKDNYNSIIKMIEKQERKREKESHFFLFGKEYSIIFDNDISIEIIDNIIYVKDEKALNNWLSKYIKITFSSHLQYWYNRYIEDIPTPNLKIRKMKTRWGVCNIENHNVTLNSELYKYDIECLDYVIVHELSHFIHANHSKEFWNQVAKYYPNYKEARKKLND